MANKTFKTRYQLACDTYENWHSQNPVLLNKEPVIVVIPTSTGAVQQEPAVMMKVGNGTDHFDDLPWSSALAADVYDWAKQDTKPTYSASEITGLDDYISGQIKDTDTQYQVVAVGGTGFKLQSKPKTGGEWSDVGSTITITYTLEEGSENGTLTFNGQSVKVHGLGTAAYTDSSAYDASGAAAGVESKLTGTAEDQSSSITIYGAKKYAEEKASAAQSAAQSYADGKVEEAKTALIGSDDDTGTNDTIKGAKKYTDAQIAAKIAAVYKPGGSVAFVQLAGLLSAENEGKVYNLTDEFTTDDSFVDGSGKKYPAGTNVVCIDTGSDAFKWDIMSGFIDLSPYDTADEAAAKVAAAKQEAISAAEQDATTKANAAKSEANSYTDGQIGAAKTELIGSEDGVTANTIKGAVKESKEYADGLNSTMDGRVNAVEGAIANKIDASAVSQIGKTGKLTDAILDDGDYIILDGGDAAYLASLG